MMKGYKAFDENLKCRNMQYEIGETYTFDGLPIPCVQGFHFCKSIADCYSFYDMSQETRICEIEASGEVVTDDNVKFCTNIIRVVKEIDNPREKSNVSLSCSGYCNTGECNSGNHNSGDYNSGDYNSGRYNSGRYNSGRHNSGRYNSGHYNSGHHNSGDYNSGHHNSGRYNSGRHNSGRHNSGDYNSGHCNSGNYNSGHYNSGDYNSGHCNSGNYNSGHYNSGIFNTSKDPKITIFDKLSEWTMDDWYDSKAYSVMVKCPHAYSEFIDVREMSDEEKQNHPEYQTIGGYIKTFVATHESKQEWWNGLSESDKNAIYNLPNFDAEKFYECTHIKVDYKKGGEIDD